MFIWNFQKAFVFFFGISSSCEWDFMGFSWKHVGFNVMLWPFFSAPRVKIVNDSRMIPRKSLKINSVSEMIYMFLGFKSQIRTTVLACPWSFFAVQIGEWLHHIASSCQGFSLVKCPLVKVYITMENHNLNRTTHYIHGHVQWLCESLPEGNVHLETQRDWTVDV